MAHGKPLEGWKMEAIIRKFMEGRSVKQIAYETDTTESTVYNFRERHPLLCRWGATQVPE